MEQTFAIIKPDAVMSGLSGEIITAIEQNGFKIVGMKKFHMTKKLAGHFYNEHRGKPFFDSLTNFMSSNPCIVMVLEKEGAILGWRELMGATNPADAKEGTLRKRFGRSLDNNAVHGSDSQAAADREIHFFFAGIALL